MSKYIQRVRLGHIKRLALVTGGGFTLTGWYDKPVREGGRIRVVLAE